MSRIGFAVFALVLALTTGAQAQTAAPPPAPIETEAKPAPSGTYQMDVNHANVIFKIKHLGFSYYAGRFDKMEATLNYNSEKPEMSEVTVTIYPNSVDTNNAKLEEELRNDKWFDVIKYPRATFRSTKIEVTSPTTGKITGDFTMMGVTKSMTLDTTLVGSGEHPMNKKPTMGFSATGTIKRTDFGFTNGVPFVGDDVTLQIDAEFNKAE